MATNDYASNRLTMESFTSQTTDVSGKINLTLQETPVADDSIVIYCSTEGHVVTLDSRTAKVVTVLITKLKYDKTDDPITGDLSNLPTGVTEATSKTTTDMAGGSETQAVEGVTYDTQLHTHGLSYIYRHDHTPTYTNTAMTVATEQGGLTITVVYAVA